MSGGLIQLERSGGHNIFLTGDPQITFFKVVYKRHTNFAIQPLKHSIQGTPKLGGKITSVIEKRGDLLFRAYLRINYTLVPLAKVSHLGHSIVKYANCKIGGQIINEYYSPWAQCWSELSEVDYRNTVPWVTLDNSIVNNSINQDDTFMCRDTNQGYLLMAGDRSINNTTGSNITLEFDTPLKFWFSKNAGLALPLVALNNTDIKFNIYFESNLKLTNETSSTLNSADLYTEYIYLDNEERLKFSEPAFDYLIEQVQMKRFNPAIDTTTKEYRLEFRHPCKEIMWAQNVCISSTSNGLMTGECAFVPLCTGISTSAPTAVLNTGETTDGTSGSVELILDGQNRFLPQPMSLFTRVFPQTYHTCTPLFDRIGIYSFALDPEKHQPSGTCNFTMFKTATLKINTGISNNLASNMYIFAVNYNVLRIMSGMAGLAYYY